MVTFSAGDISPWNHVVIAGVFMTRSIAHTVRPKVKLAHPEHTCSGWAFLLCRIFIIARLGHSCPRRAFLL